MATASRQLEMPSLFTPRPLNGRNSRTHVFAPAPRFSTTSDTSGRQVIDSGVHETRFLKRSRHDRDSNASLSNAQFTSNAWADSSLSISRLSNARSPPPLANDRYELAGGMEGTDRFGRHNGDYDDYFHLGTQRGMWSTPTNPPFDLPSQQLTDDTPNGTKPWVLNQILNIVGGVAGRLVQFCAVPFRGFQAGGGQAYTFDSQGEIAARLGLHDNPFTNDTAGAIQQPLPRAYPEDSYGVLSVESLEDERPRMSKRLRTGENWVVVDKTGGMESRPSTPRLSERRVPQVGRSSSQIPRPMSRAGSSIVTPKRPSLIPVSRRSTTDRKSFHGASKVPANPYSTPRSYSRQSYSSPVMFDDKSSNSPLPPDSQRLINKMRREELEDDARMRRMSSQMSSMLREAREALGSKIEVEYDDMDSGGMDDEGCSEDRSWNQRWD